MSASDAELYARRVGEAHDVEEVARNARRAIEELPREIDLLRARVAELEARQRRS